MEDFGTINSSVSSALVSTTRSTAQLAAEDISFHRSLDPSTGPLLDRQNARLLGLATRLLGSATANSETVRPPSLKDVDTIDGNWRAVVDVVDSLLERADSAMDEFAGAVKRMSPGANEQASHSLPTARHAKFGVRTGDHAMEKPQLLFQNAPNNYEAAPFKPLMSRKPHSNAILLEKPIAGQDGSPSFYPHPYQTEIEQYRYPTSVYSSADPIPYHPFDQTTATLVDTEEGLSEMLEELKRAKEIAIDLEHHDQRSFIGIVCLMQISTRERDWIVDTLRPWRRRLECLNEVLADPSIVKVLHGAFMDAVWLQRDFGLYLVGLFDTHHAARALGYPGGSLAFLLKKFINFDAQKQYQLADWRVRPLPKELFDYARSDTHFLLYIYDCMRNELIQRSDFSKPNHEGDKIQDVLERSSEVALQRYDHPIYDAELGQGGMGWYKILSRTPALLSKEQFAVFRAVHKWRDGVAREQDDSTKWIMPNHQIFSIAREMPTDRPTLLGLAQPISQTLRLRADELVAIVREAKAKGKDGPDMMDVLNRVEPQLPKVPIEVAAPSHSVAAYVPQKTTHASTNGTPSTTTTGRIRSFISSFWGHSFDSSAHKPREMSTVPDVSLSIPLPPLTAEIFADPATTFTETPVPQTPATPKSDTTPRQEQDDEIFTLNQLSKKRKQAFDRPGSDGMATQNDEVSLDDGNDKHINHQRARADKKKAKREAKAARKAAAAPPSSDGLGSGHEEVPFDYASAPSMLAQPVESKEERRARKKKEVNPYAKALDTAKGLPRNQKERAGRSMTFQS